MQAPSLIWGRRHSRLLYALGGVFLLMVLVTMAIPNLLRSRMAVPKGDVSTRNQSRAVQELAPYVDTEKAIAGAVGVPGSDRKVVRTGTLSMVVDHPANAIEAIEAVAHRHQGYVVTSELNGAQQSQQGNITIRVPVTHFDAARADLKKIAKHVESEQTSSDDATMRMAENEATLRNFRAEEASYLEIMKGSGAVRDTLQVAQKLSEVRGRIERLEAQIRTMSVQTEMAAIQVAVAMEPVAVAPQHWSPVYELRTAWNDGVDALAGYATAMLAVLMYLPAILAWIVTIAVGAKLILVLLRLGYRMFVPKSQTISA